MYVKAISSQTFEAKKFRLPVKIIQTKWGDIPVDCIKEFDNPQAEELYKKAQQNSNLKEKVALLSQMGDYKIIDNSLEKRINKFLKRVLT